MDSGLISVIVPVYNTVRWLPKCIDSILGQDYKNIEVILVNDASTDKSLDVCRRYADADKRIRIIDKPKNEGLEQARISGYGIARGEYVMHVDSDDWLDHPQVLLRMYAKAEETGADYVLTGMQKVIDSHKWFKISKNTLSVSGLIDKTELKNKYYLSFFGVQLLPISVWGKLYRKSTLDKADIKAQGIFYGEDLVYNMQLFPYLQKIYILDDVGYNYRYGGMSSRYDLRVFDDLKRIYFMKEEFIERNGYDRSAYGIIRSEIVNVLKSEICQRIAFGGQTHDEVIAYIESEMKQPLYEKVLAAMKDSEADRGLFADAFLRGDFETMYEMCRREGAKLKNRRMLKFFINIIQRL